MADRDFLFDTDLFSPSTKCKDFRSLMTLLEHPPGEEPEFLRRAFHQFEDGRNSMRAIETIMRLLQA